MEIIDDLALSSIGRYCIEALLLFRSTFHEFIDKGDEKLQWNCAVLEDSLQDSGSSVELFRQVEEAVLNGAPNQAWSYQLWVSKRAGSDTLHQLEHWPCDAKDETDRVGVRTIVNCLLFWVLNYTHQTLICVIKGWVSALLLALRHSFLWL